MSHVNIANCTGYSWVIMTLSLLSLFYVSNARITQNELYLSNLTFVNETNRRLKTVFSLFDKSSELCIVSNDSEITGLFLIMSRLYFKPVLVLSGYEINTYLCDNFVFLDVDLTRDCNVFSRPFNPSVTSFYLLHHKTSLTIALLDECLSTSWLAKVVTVSIQDDVVMELSPVYPTPRHFIPTTISRISQSKNDFKMPDLGGEVIKAVTTLYQPFTIYDYENTVFPFDELYGIESLILKHMALKLNFTVYNITGYFENWGILLPNNTFQGGIGQALAEGSADMAIEHAWLIKLLHGVMDFGPPIDQFEWSFLTRRPTQESFHWMSLLSIFHWEVHLATVVAFVAVVVSHHFNTNHNLHKHSKVAPGWMDCIMSVLGVFTMTYSSSSKAKNSFIMTSWSIFALLIATSLSTNIVLRLSLPVFTPRIDSTQQLVEGGYYWSSIFYGDQTNAEFKNSFFDSNNYWDTLFEKRHQELTYEELVDRLGIDMKLTLAAENRGKFAVSLSGGTENHSALQDYRMSKATVMKIYTSCFALRKQSPLMEPFSWIVNIFMGTGLIQHWWDEVLTEWPVYNYRHLLREQDQPVFGEPQPLRLNQIQALFLILLIGLVFAFVVFIIEIVNHNATVLFLNISTLVNTF